MRRLAIIAFAAIAFASNVAHAANLEGKWRLATLPDASKFDATKTELAFLAGDRVAMTVGCNRMSASVTVGEGLLKFGPIMATRMACLPQLMSLEAAFQNAIGRTVSFKRDGTTLTLRDASNEVVATFSKKE